LFSKDIIKYQIITKMVNPIQWGITKTKELNHAIWNTRLSDISKQKGFLIRNLRVVVLAARGFSQNKVQLRAASLTLYTLLSVIPMAAIAFAVAKGFGLDADLEREIIQKFASQQDLLNQILSIARGALLETKGGYLAGVGVIILFWSVMNLLDQIESSFNHTWQVRQSRPWMRKFTDYLAMMLIAPVFIILSSSITVFVSTQLSEFMETAPILDYFKPLITFLVKLTPYFIMWLILTLAYIALPNTKVKFSSALIAGIVAGTLVQVTQWLYIDLQWGISRLSAIYGSFAAIPLFIVWIQTTWLIVLLGAEISFAKQNVARYEFESDALKISSFHRKVFTILILHAVVKNFRNGVPPQGAEVLASDLKIPVRISSEILNDLKDAGLVSEILHDQDKQRTYQPGMDINMLTVGFVLNRLENIGTDHSTVLKSREYNKVLTMLSKFDKLMMEADQNILLKDL
jgi:membrane protein